MARPSFNPQDSSFEEDSNDERPNPGVGNADDDNQEEEGEGEEEGEYEDKEGDEEEEVDYPSTPFSRSENETTNFENETTNFGNDTTNFGNDTTNFGNDTTNFEGYGYPDDLNRNWDDDDPEAEVPEAEETRIEIETFFKVGGGKGARKTVPKTGGTGNKKTSAGRESDAHNLDKDKNWTAPVNPLTQMLPGIPPTTGGRSNSGMTEVSQPFEDFTGPAESGDDDSNNHKGDNDPSPDPSDEDDEDEPSPSPNPPTDTDDPPAPVLTIPYSSYQRLPATGLHIQVQPDGLEAWQPAAAMPQTVGCDHLPQTKELERNLTALQAEFDVEWKAGVAALAAAGTVEDAAAAETRRKEAVEEILGFPNMEIIKERMVKERFLRLQGLVADLANTYFAGDEMFRELAGGVGGRVDVALNEMVRRVVRNFPLEVWNTPLLLEAVVWHALRREIFDIDSEVWGDKFGAFMFRYFSDMIGEFLWRGDVVLEAGLMGWQTKSMRHVQSSSPKSTSSGRAWSTALAVFTST